MASLTSIRNGLETRLATISGLEVFDRIPDQIEAFPAAVVAPPEGELFWQYDQALGQAVADLITLAVRVFVGRVDAEHAQTQLDAFIASSGASSVRVAIEGDRTLGGACDTLSVTGARRYGAYSVGDAGIQLLGVEFLVTIVTSS